MELMQDISNALRHFWGLWLMAIFVGIIVWAYRPKNKRRFEDDAMIPLREGANEERNDGAHS